MQPKPIRSFSRGLTLLAALNQLGSASALTLARETGLPRATVYRLLQTLLDDGYIGRGAADDRFRLRFKVRTLSGGFEDEHWISAVAAPALAELTQRIAWPCDIVTLEGLKMIIRDTTHPVAPLSIDHNMVGRALPIRAKPRVLGCISAIWMARAMDYNEGLRRCLDALRETRSLIEQRLKTDRGG
jgi:IclR family mhp operon transcriptional activator